MTEKILGLVVDEYDELPAVDASRPCLLSYAAANLDIGGEQYVADVTTTLLQTPPADIRLHTGKLHRETGISMPVAGLPVTPT